MATAEQIWNRPDLTVDIDSSMEGLKPSFLPGILADSHRTSSGITSKARRIAVFRRLKLERIISVPSRPLRLIVSVNFCMASEMNFVAFPSAGFARRRVMAISAWARKPMSSTP